AATPSTGVAFAGVGFGGVVGISGDFETTVGIGCDIACAGFGRSMGGVGAAAAVGFEAGTVGLVDATP
ncbi:MAG: hypothetical protein ACYSN9_04515, partial [Planctomycetota bacterium]